MPQDVYLVDRLVIGFEGQPERTAGSDADTLSIGMWFKNPVGKTGSTRRPPGMELRDSSGRIYEPSNTDWAEPVLPDTEMRAQVEFEIAPDALGFELVLAPGQPEEVLVSLGDMEDAGLTP